MASAAPPAPAGCGLLHVHILQSKANLCASHLLHLYPALWVDCLSGSLAWQCRLCGHVKHTANVCACLLQMKGSTSFLKEELLPICERTGVKNARVRCSCVGQAVDRALYVWCCRTRKDAECLRI